jgi:hypothetical protein
VIGTLQRNRWRQLAIERGVLRHGHHDDHADALAAGIRE